MKLTIPQTVLPIPGGAGVRKMKGVQNPEVQEFRSSGVQNDLIHKGGDKKDNNQ